MSEGNSGLLAIELKRMQDLKLWLTTIGHKEDYNTLMDWFKKSYQRKQRVNNDL